MRTIFIMLLMGAFALNTSAQQYDLKLNLKKGSHYNQSMLMDLNMTESMGGQDITIATKMTFEFIQDVKSITSAGNFVLEVQYSRIAMVMNAMGQNMAYDSKVKDTTADPMSTMLGSAFDKILGKKFQITLTPKGKVVEIKGLKEILSSLEKSKDPTTQKMVEGVFDESKMVSNFESSYHIFPDNPVKVGDSWSQKKSIETMFPIDISTGYKLLEVNNGIAKIAATGDFSMKNDKYEANGMTMKVDFSGSYSGTYNMEIATGINKSGFIAMPMKGTMEVMGMEVPVTVNSSIQMTATPLD